MKQKPENRRITAEPYWAQTPLVIPMEEYKGVRWSAPKVDKYGYTVACKQIRYFIKNSHFGYKQRFFNLI